MKTISVKDIPHLIDPGNYVTDVFLYEVPKKIAYFQEEYGLILNPDFQRGHVWTAEQQSAYIEFVLRGGNTARDFYFNHPGWMNSFEGEFVCVDGLQRISAIIDFFNNTFPVFGDYTASQITGIKNSLNYVTRFYINRLQTRKEVLQWYIEFNAGGTPHSKEEIERVRKLMESEESKQ